MNNNMKIKYINKYVGELIITPMDCRIEEGIELSKEKVINNKGTIINIFRLNKNDFLNRKNNNIDIEKELKFIKNYPETTDKVDSFIFKKLFAVIQVQLLLIAIDCYKKM